MASRRRSGETPEQQCCDVARRRRNTAARASRLNGGDSPWSTGHRTGGEMADPAADSPASLQMFRYTAGDDTVRAVIGEVEAGLPIEELVAHAKEALKSETFMCYAVSLLRASFACATSSSMGRPASTSPMTARTVSSPAV